MPHFLKYYLTILFTISYANFLYAQDQRINELREQLTAARTDTGRINLLSEMGKKYQDINPDSSLYFFSQSLKNAQKIKVHKSSANMMYQIGYTYMYHVNDEDKALEWFNRSIKLAKSHNDFFNLARCHLLLGVIAMHQHIGDAYESFNVALNYAQKANDWKVASDSYNLMSDYFLSKKNFEKAEAANLKAMNISYKHDIDTWLSQGLDHCDLLEKQGKNTQSFLFAKKLNAFRDNLNMSKGYFVYINDLGRLETKLKNFHKAENLFLKILNEETQKAKTDTFHLYHIFKHLEALYLVQGYYKKAYKVGQDVSNTRLWLAQKRQNRDSQFKMMKLKATADLDKKETEIKLLAEQKKEQWILLVTAIMIVFLMIGFVIILQRNQKKIELQKTELINLNATKNKLFSIIAHDLRSPIASTKGILSLFEDDSLSKYEFIELSKDLQKNVDSIHTMLENLLLWSLSQMEGIKPKPRPLIIHELIDETFDLFKEIARQKNIQLQKDIAANLIVIMDENLLKAVIRNLIHNALKFTPQNGNILVEGSSSKGTSITLKIIDSGIGIKPEDLPFILSNPKINQGTSGEKGTGLGLMLCRDLIEKNRGKISVSSLLGKGSTFEVILPLSIN